MLTPFCRSISIAMLVLFSVLVKAETNTADQFIKALTDRLEITLTEAKKNNRLSDVTYIDQLIDEEILPHINLDVLCKRIYREHWKDILDKNKKQVAIDAVVLSLKRTYRLAVSAYSGQAIAITNSKQLKSYDIVRINISSKGENDHMIDFALRQFDGVWKIFDFSVDGIGISKTLHSSISQQIKNDGLEATIEALAQTDQNASES